ncbi:MAG: AbrB/MazE/SpoVT family DNA-binding domain-containing protein [Candidatus Nanohaloarchaea archaeon]
MVTVPRELAKAMGWKKGEKLFFSVNGSESLVLTSQSSS